ncbi:MAG: hypothetical protein LBQ52_08575 [Helicobacteraceae bacterium]|jgi:hypothetical protein|nr:hypothetical protein [Helicobacteraceae bacterium]
MDNQLNKWFGNSDENFEATENQPIIPQIEIFAKSNDIELPEGWKVLLAKSVKTQLLKDKAQVDDSAIKTWASLFERVSKD